MDLSDDDVLNSSSKVLHRVKKRANVIESDDESIPEKSDSEQKDQRVYESDSETIKARRKNLVTSDSEEETEITSHNKSFPDEDNQSKDNKSESEDESTITKKNDNFSDSESVPEEDNASQTDLQTETFNESDEIIAPIPYKYKKSNKAMEKPLMTAQEAANQRVEIQSESQRMARESEISLPYHKPKSYTIKEFMAKRSKLPVLKIPKAPPALAMKLMQTQLAEFSRQVDERLKQVKEIYKSESEEEEENEQIVENPIENSLETEMKSIIESIINTVVGENDEMVDISAEPNLSEEPNPATTETVEKLDESLENLNPISPHKKKTYSELIQEKYGASKPKLSGEPGKMIDLDTEIAGPSHVEQLVNKFFQHSAKRTPLTQEKQLKILGVTSSGKIVEEEFTTNIEIEEDKRAIIEIPGAKLKKLRNELENQIARKRSELWKQKLEHDTEKDVFIGETDECGALDAILDDEDEEEMEISDEECEEEEELVENDVDLTETNAIKSAFIDEEAEVSDFEDNNDGEESEAEIEEPEPKMKILKRIIQAFSDSESDNEPEEAFNAQKTPKQNTAKSTFDFLTPVGCLTGLKSNQLAKNSPINSPLILPGADPSPLKDWDTSEHMKIIQKKLFSDEQPELTATQADKELMDVCSGAFPATQTDLNTSDPINTQDLLGICTGAFSEAATVEILANRADNEVKQLNKEDDELITQLMLDEEAMAKLKKQFESPIISNEVNATGFIHSDEENDDLEVKTKRKRQKKLLFSDDEDVDDDIKVGDDVEYDSEENEVEKRLKIADFLDEEAELSESEWGSADEDEKGMDELEFEEGDKEDIDQDKVRQDIERIHMRQLLDDDQRDVKILQEMLLEDGELHGSGRQRQFRWKNIDAMDESEGKALKEDDFYFDEEEEEDSEEQFRKMRLKREMFLQQNCRKEGDIDVVLGESSSTLKMGHEALKKAAFEEAMGRRPADKELSKRGSFLTRTDKVLQRLSKHNKVTSGALGAAVKNSRGFVFQTIDRTESVSTITTNVSGTKRKAFDGTPNAIKKLRLDNASPADAKKPKKSNVFTRLF